MGTRVFCLVYPPRGVLVLGAITVPSQTPLSHMTVLTGTGTYTTPTGILLMGAIIEAVGPGGAGGGAALTAAGQASCGGGGGGGGYARTWLTPAQQGASQSYAIGAAGAGVSAADGGTGGTTRYGPVSTPLCRATGGVGGLFGGVLVLATNPANPVPGGTGGVGTHGGLLVHGGGGSLGVRAAASRGGTGGSSVLGGGAALMAQDAAGVVGGNYGGGGSGANNDGADGTPARAGGDGGPGAIVVTLFFRD